MSQIVVKSRLTTDLSFLRTQIDLPIFELLLLEKDDREEILTDFLRTNEGRGTSILIKPANVTEQIGCRDEKSGQDATEVAVIEAATFIGHEPRESILQKGNSMLSSVWIG